LRVLGVTPLYPPDSRVGAWLSTHECLAELVRRGHHVEVATTMCGATYELDGVTVIGRGKELHTRGADVVVSHLGDQGEGARAASKAGVPSVRMVHGNNPAGASKLEGTRLAVFNSNSLREAIGWDGESIVVHPPVDPTQHQTTPGHMVTLVNMSPEKGVHTFDVCAAALPELQFLGVRGDYGRQRKPQRPNIELIRSTKDMKTDVWSRTRVLLMPSEAESWGRVGVEALCSGIPVIAHPTPGLLESLGDAGIFVDRSDITGWVAEIRRLQDPDEWAEASQAALRRAAEFDHLADLARFADAVEALVRVPA
jgi:hypothetical protein